jgi:flagellar biosynthetic protein FlhB
MAENADDSQSKTEEPTQKRLDKARDDGQILRSQDFSVAVTLFGFAALIFVIAGVTAETFKRLYHYNFILDASVTTDAGQMIEKIAGSMRIVLPLLGLVCSLALIGVLVSSSLFGGIGFSLKAAAPKFSKLNPLNGLKRMFGPTALFELSKNLAKTLVIGTVTGLTLFFSINALSTLSVIPVNLALQTAGGILVIAMLLITVSLFMIAMIDMPWQYFQHRKKLRMSLRDIKDEMKDSDGRPEVKARQRQRQREIAMNQMMAAVEHADVIITNPKHFAVALSYTPGTSDAPRVVAKGVDLVAARIRDKAAEHQVPVFESPELARALYFTTRLDDMIPESLYHTVAEVIAYIFNLSAALKSGRPLQRPRPVVPAEMRFNENGEPLIDL